MKTYSLVCASRRRSHWKPRSGDPVSRTDLARIMPQTARMVPEASGSRIRILPFHFGSSRSSQSRGASLGRDRLRVVDEHRRRAVEGEVEIARLAARGRDRVRPRRPVGSEQAVPRAAREDRVGPAEPDVRLRVRLLRPHPVVDLLRAHVEPAHVDVGMGALELLLDQRQEIAPVGRVEDERRAGVAAAARTGPAAATQDRGGRFGSASSRRTVTSRRAGSRTAGTRRARRPGAGGRRRGPCRRSAPCRAARRAGRPSAPGRPGSAIDEQRRVLRRPGAGEVEAALLHPAVPVGGPDAVGSREDAGSTDRGSSPAPFRRSRGRAAGRSPAGTARSRPGRSRYCWYWTISRPPSRA